MHAATRMNLENNMLSVMSQSQKDQYCMIPRAGEYLGYLQLEGGNGKFLLNGRASVWGDGENLEVVVITVTQQCEYNECP